MQEGVAWEKITAEAVIPSLLYYWVQLLSFVNQSAMVMKKRRKTSASEP
jgi:hypothetical protein